MKKSESDEDDNENQEPEYEEMGGGDKKGKKMERCQINKRKCYNHHR